jgi:putative ABC transport system ATP-binding protein
MIELKKVTRAFELGGEKIFALDKVNLKIEAGDFVAIMGASGSGKSTLANVIGGLDNPDAGQVLVEGQDIAEMGDKQLSHFRNKKVGFIFQTFNLHPTYTALENVMLPLMLAKIPFKKRKQRALECLQAVGLGDRLRHLPGQLSGGQRQRVCIARALANQPEMIIADEPTGNLDSKRGAEIMKLLKGLNQTQGVTLIVITHDQSVAKLASRIITMKDGRLI